MMNFHISVLCIKTSWLIVSCFYLQQGWLIDFVNHFGMLGGFKLLQERICEGGSLSVSLLAALIRYAI